MNRLMMNGLSAGLVLAAGGVSADVIFQDTFDRDASRNIDASLAGVTDNTGSSLSADGVYGHGFIDPANDPGPQDGDATNGGGAEIASNALRLAVGAGTSNAYVNHNFINGSILTEGGFSVSVDIAAPGGFQQGGAFAVGMSASEAAAGGDAFNNFPNEDTGGPAYSWAFNDTTGGQDGKPAGNVVSDFWVGLRGNQTVIFGGAEGSNATVVNVGANSGTLSAEFFAPDFNAGTAVSVNVYFDGNLIGSDSFTWSETDANFIGLDARDGVVVPLDNFVVSTVPEPASLALLALGGLALGRRRRG